MRTSTVRRQLRLAETLLREGCETKGPHCLGRRVGRDGNRLERTVEVESLVKSEVEVLPRLGLIGESR